ncbi:MAG TPA: hypothetical protein VGR18_11465 [Rubrobacter sp.]|nr:hypothetical protein [Rubrobacter sp.]
MQTTKAPEFSLDRPLSSALATIRAVLFSPRAFYANFGADGPLREPALFVLLVGTVTGALGAAVALASNVATGGIGADDLRAAVVEGLLFALLSPVGVAVAAAVYLLSIRTFVGNVANFPQAYRLVAYAYSAFVFAWVPVLGSVAISYALLVLMGVAIKEVYGTSFLTAVITALVGFVPVGSALVWITAVALTS